MMKLWNVHHEYRNTVWIVTGNTMDIALRKAYQIFKEERIPKKYITSIEFLGTVDK
jgi:hypothetical protein